MKPSSKKEHKSAEYYEEILLKSVAKSRGCSLAEADQILKKCISKTAAKKGVTFAEVYAQVYHRDRVWGCATKVLKDRNIPFPHTQEECMEDCRTVWFKSCIPRFFPDVEEINRDPVKYAETHLSKTKDLQDFVERASFLYYNYEAGGLTDNSFDALEYVLRKKMKIKARYYEKIGAPPVDKIKAQLPFHMGSLEKVKPGMKALGEYVSSGPLFWSLKLDGVSALIDFRGPEIKIYSRGDGTIGGDVSYLRDYITLPIGNFRSKGLVVRGELVIPTLVFEERYSLAYSNSRSFVSAKVNSGYVSQGLSDIEFWAYEIVEMKGSNASSLPGVKTFSVLEDLGFKTPSHGVIKDPTVFGISYLYRQLRGSSPIKIDGLVISPEIPNPVLPKVAFKMMLEEQARWTRIINIEWNISRYGKLIPKAIFEGVYVDEVRLSKASLHNARKVVDDEIGIGSEVKVVRSGDVIPMIKETKPSPNSALPDESIGWVWKGAHIYLKDIEGNMMVKIGRMTHFFEITGVPGIREGNVTTLFKAGFTTLQKIVSAKVKDFQAIKGYGAKKSQSLYDNLRQTLGKLRFDRLVAATSLVEGISRKTIQKVLQYHPTLFKESTEVLAKSLTAKKIPGIGPAKIKVISEGIPRVVAFFKSLSKEDYERARAHEDKRIAILTKQPKNPKIYGKKVVFTGFMNNVPYDLEDFIYDSGGDIVDSTDGASYVICYNVYQISDKMRSAKEKDIPVYTVEEFSKRVMGGIDVEVPPPVEGDD
jgi:DNA ligase (NAD+)